MHARQKQERGGKCPVTSEAITALTSYLWHCFPPGRADYQPGDIYGFIKAVIEVITTPACPACQRLHRFATWQRVRIWDRFHSPWQEREQRRRAAIEADLRRVGVR
jgi:hypothetical protein